MIDFLLVLIELLSSAHTIEADISRNRCVLNGVGQSEHKFKGEWGVAHQQLLASEN